MAGKLRVIAAGAGVVVFIDPPTDVFFSKGNVQISKIDISNVES
jgi:hypothetical protein